MGWWQEILPCVCRKALTQAAQRSCSCPIPGMAQDQAEQDLEKFGLVEDVPTQGMGVECMVE